MNTNRRTSPAELAVSASTALAVHLIEKFGAVVPFGISIEEPDCTPRTFFPRDRFPGLDFSALVDKVVDELRIQVSQGNVLTTVTVSEVQLSDGLRGFATQIESAMVVTLLIYPYQLQDTKVVVGEPKYEEGLIMFSGTYPSTNEA